MLAIIGRREPAVGRGGSSGYSLPMRSATLVILLIPFACGGTAIVDGSEIADSCDDIRDDFGDALDEAKGCVTNADCTALVFSTLDCPCEETFVNPNSTAALDSIRNDFTAASCGSESCPTIACVAPPSAVCSEGVCVDMR